MKELDYDNIIININFRFDKFIFSVDSNDETNLPIKFHEDSSFESTDKINLIGGGIGYQVADTGPVGWVNFWPGCSLVPGY